MLKYDAASSTDSYVAFWFDPYYAVAVSESRIKHESCDVGHNRKFLSLDKHVVGDEASYSARSQDPKEVQRDVVNEFKKLFVVSEQTRIIKGGIIVGRTGHDELYGLTGDFHHVLAVSEDHMMSRDHGRVESSSVIELKDFRRDLETLREASPSPARILRANTDSEGARTAHLFRATTIGPENSLAASSRGGVGC